MEKPAVGAQGSTHGEPKRKLGICPADVWWFISSGKNFQGLGPRLVLKIFCVRACPFATDGWSSLFIDPHKSMGLIAFPTDHLIENILVLPTD